MHVNPPLDEVLPLFHPASLLQASFRDFWLTYVLLVPFVVAVVVTLVSRTDQRAKGMPRPILLWALPPVCAWGLQLVRSLLAGWHYSVLYVKVDVLVGLTTLAVLVVLLAPSIASLAKRGLLSAKDVLWLLGTGSLVVVTVLFNCVVWLFFASPFS